VTEPTFRDVFAEARRMFEYWEEGAVLDFTETLYVAMQEQGVARTELARRLGTSQACITRVLGGHANITLKTMAKLALALGLQLEAGLGPQRLPSAAAKAEEEDARWSASPAEPRLSINAAHSRRSPGTSLSMKPQTRSSSTLGYSCVSWLRKSTIRRA
jgi:plasmid maintenance system antidote protein VapI